MVWTSCAATGTLLVSSCDGNGWHCGQQASIVIPWLGARGALFEFEGPRDCGLSQFSERVAARRPAPAPSLAPLL